MRSRIYRTPTKGSPDGLARRVALLVGVAVLVLVANVGGSILYMVVYGHIAVSLATKLAAGHYGATLRIARSAEPGPQ